MKATNAGVNMDQVHRTQAGGIRVPTTIIMRDYVDAKYEGLPEQLRRIILYPCFQLKMQQGKH